MAVTYFTPDTPQQSNPVLAGVGAAQNIYSQGIQNAYLPQNLAAQIALMKAQAGLAGAQTQFFPMTAAGQYYGGLGRYLQGSYAFSPIHQYASIQNNPNTQALIANNPAYAQAATNITAGALSGGLPGGGGMPGAMGNPNMQIPGMPAPSVNMPQPVGTTPDGMPVTGAQQNTINSLQGQIGALQAGASSPQNASDVKAIQNASGSDLQQKITPNAVLMQRQYSQILDPLLAQGQKLMPSVAKYSGLTGTAALTYDKAKAALGYNSPDYTNYMLFTQTLAPNIANELRRVLGGQATDSELKVMDNLADPTYWHSNPQLALRQYGYLTDLYQNTVNPAIAQSPAQVQQNLQKSIASPTPTSTPSANASSAPKTPQMTKSLNGQTYVKIDGKWYQQ